MYKPTKTTIALGLSALATQASADSPANWSNGYNHMMWGNGFGMLGGVMMLRFLIVSVAVLILVLKWLGFAPNTTTKPSPSALEILQQRFAKGEIDEAEFEKRQADKQPMQST